MLAMMMALSVASLVSGYFSMTVLKTLSAGSFGIFLDDGAEDLERRLVLLHLRE